MYLLLIIPGMIAFIILLCWFIVFLSETLLRLLIDRKQQDVEAIMYSGYAPPEWGKKGIARLGIDRLSKAMAMRRLSKMIRHIQHAPFVESADGRRIAVRKLKEVRQSWKSMQWREISPSK